MHFSSQFIGKSIRFQTTAELAVNIAVTIVLLLNGY